MSLDSFGDKDRERLSKYQYSSFASTNEDEPSEPSNTDRAKQIAKSQAKKYIKKTIRDAAIANPEISIPIIIVIVAIILVLIFVIVMPLLFSYLTGSSAGAATCSPSSISLSLPNIPASALTGPPWQPPLGDPAVTQPYYLEEFATNVLEDLASKLNVPPSQAVTQEHVIALIGWFWAEGGDINNPDLFNLLNIRNNTGGFISYSSFGAGVEGLTEAFVNPFQDRIAGILTQQTSTAEQVALVIGNFQNYSNNLSWSSPGGSPTTAQVVTYDQNTYLPEIDSSIEQARANYSSEASLKIGTAAYESQNPSKYSVSTSLLKYSQSSAIQTGTSAISSTTTATTSTGTSSCTSNVNCTSATPTTASTTSSSNLSTLRQNVVCIATNELNQHWQGGSSLSNLSLDYFTTYTEGRHEEWCADFVSWVYNQAGYPVSGSSTNWDYAGVSEIQTVGETGGNFSWHAVGSGYTPQPGDLAVLSAPGNSDYHIEMVIAVNGSSVTYIGGDTGGSFPNGNDGYGGTGIPYTRGYQNYSYVSENTATEYYQGDVVGYVSPNN